MFPDTPKDSGILISELSKGIKEIPRLLYLRALRVSFICSLCLKIVSIKVMSVTHFWYIEVFCGSRTNAANVASSVAVLVGESSSIGFPVLQC